MALRMVQEFIYRMAACTVAMHSSFTDLFYHGESDTLISIFDILTHMS